MRDLQDDLSKHMPALLKLMRRRFKDLGMAEKLPDKAAIRLVIETFVDFGLALAEYEESEGMGQGHLLRLPDGEKALVVNEHRLAPNDDGRICAYHRDGEECHSGGVICGICDCEDIFIRQADGEYSAVCGQCGAFTKQFPNDYDAIIAWLEGNTFVPKGDENAPGDY